MRNTTHFLGLSGRSAALLSARLIVAAVFFAAGYAKLSFWETYPQGTPAGMLWLIRILAVAEPLGAIALAAGIFTRFTALAMSFVMVGAIVTLRFSAGIGFFTMPQTVGLDYNFLILVLCLLIAVFGAGKWSGDAIWRKRLDGKVYGTEKTHARRKTGH